MSTAPVIAVVSPKGGNGKTTVSANLAAALGRRTPTVVVDLDVHFGDIEYAFRLHPLHRLDDAVRSMVEHPDEGLEHLLTSHPTGVEALCAPADPVAADHLTPEEVFGVVDELITLDRPILLDTAGGMSEFSLGALDRATEIVIVCATDVPSVQSVRKLLDTMTRLGLDPSCAHLAVNRSTSKCGLSVRDVEQVIGMKAAIEIPEHASLGAGMNQGCPVVESDPGSAIGSVFTRFADQILGLDALRTGRRRFLARSDS